MAISIQSFNLTYYSYRLYDVNFFDDTIKTLVTQTPCIVETWLSDIQRLHHHRLNDLIVGLDIEWRPNFIAGAGGNRYNSANPAATLQLCVGRNCLVFQLIFAPLMPQSLIDFLADTDYTFVGVGIGRDAAKLRADYGLEVGNVVDLGVLARTRLRNEQLFNAGLVALAREVLGKEFVKPRDVTLSDWDDAWLSDDQVQYACVDAFVSFEIGLRLGASRL